MTGKPGAIERCPSWDQAGNRARRGHLSVSEFLEHASRKFLADTGYIDERSPTEAASFVWSDCQRPPGAPSPSLVRRDRLNWLVGVKLSRNFGGAPNARDGFRLASASRVRKLR